MLRVSSYILFVLLPFFFCAVLFRVTPSFLASLLHVLFCFVFGHLFPSTFLKFPITFPQDLEGTVNPLYTVKNLLPNFLFRSFSHSCSPSTQGHCVNPAQLRELSVPIYFHSLRYTVFLYSALSPTTLCSSKLLLDFTPHFSKINF